MLYEATRLEHAKHEADLWAFRMARRCPLGSDARLVDYSKREDRYDAARRAERWRRKYGEGESR
jgi:hypothetical protein